MNIRDFVRLTVAKTNPYWPFSTLNRVPYSLAIKSFLRMAKTFPEIKSVYLRHGLLRKDWIPAISDVDLTLIIESELNPEKEFQFLTAFWTEFKRLKRLFPMLGEMDILPEKQCDAWVSVTIRGYEAKDWVLLWGEQTLPEISPRTDETVRYDSMDHAMICYLTIFLERVFDERPTTPLFDYEIKRLTSKILRYIYYGEPVRAQNGFLQPLGYIPALIKSFDEQLQTITKNVQHSSENISAVEKVISSVILSHNWDVLILKEGVDVPPGFDWITTARNILKGRKGPPTILSKRMFEYFIRFYDPFLYYHLSEFGKLVYGDHPVHEITEPEISSFIRSMFKQVPNVMSFPQTAELVAPDLYSPHSERRLDSMLEHVLLLKLYHEKGLISRRYRDLLSASREHYSDYFQEHTRLSKIPSTLERFEFWKALAREVYNFKPHSLNDSWKH